MQRVKLSLACLFCLSVVGVAHAQTALESDSGVVVMQDYSGSATFAGTYFDIRTMTGDGVGYRNGYTQLGVFSPLWKDSDQFIAPNSRLIITDLGDVGANSGLVYRRYKPENDRIFGANAYFDYDQSVEGFTYHQIGFGFETLSATGWDARTNVYIPTTHHDNFVRPLALDCTTPLLQGNAIGFLATGLFQQSIEGVDFEFGHQLTKSTPWLRGYAGAYFYDAPKDNPIGVRARIDAQISNDLSVGVNVTNDTNFGTNVNAVVDFRFSGWLPTRYFPNYTTQERMLASVQRNWRIATANTSRDVFAPAKNPDTGNPFFIVWVDSSNPLPGPGTGTFENPLHEVPNSASGADIIVVKVGESTLIDPYRASIVLEDNQRLLGEGKAHQIQLISMFEGLMCPVVTTTLPGIATDGNFPYLTSVGNNNVVTIQNNNEVSAFNIVRAGGFAVTNFPAVGSHDFNLNCLNLTNNTAGGIALTNASGTGIIKTVNAINNTGGGIFIDSAPAGLNLTVMDVVSSSVAAAPGFPQAFGLQLSANPGQITANITDSEFNRNTVGIILKTCSCRFRRSTRTAASASPGS
jgi:trimeric autotransporter adhesin